MTFGFWWNLPFYTLGLITLILMIFWPCGTDKTPVEKRRR